MRSAENSSQCLLTVEEPAIFMTLQHSSASQAVTLPDVS